MLTLLQAEWPLRRKSSPLASDTRPMAGGKTLSPRLFGLAVMPLFAAYPQGPTHAVADGAPIADQHVLLRPLDGPGVGVFRLQPTNSRLCLEAHAGTLGVWKSSSPRSPAG